MVTSRSPLWTSAPSRKCTDCTVPATRERRSTRSTASRRPENSSQVATSACVTAATDTGVAWGAAGSASACTWGDCSMKARPAAAMASTRAVPTASRRLRPGRGTDGSEYGSANGTDLANPPKQTQKKTSLPAVLGGRFRQCGKESPAWGGSLLGALFRRHVGREEAGERRPRHGCAGALHGLVGQQGVGPAGGRRQNLEIDRHARGAQLVGIGTGLVAHGVVGRGQHQRGRNAGQPQGPAGHGIGVGGVLRAAQV